MAFGAQRGARILERGVWRPVEGGKSQGWHREAWQSGLPPGRTQQTRGKGSMGQRGVWRTGGPRVRKTESETARGQLENASLQVGENPNHEHIKQEASAVEFRLLLSS